MSDAKTAAVRVTVMRHAEDRLRERYGIALEDREWAEIARILLSCGAPFRVSPKYPGRRIHYVELPERRERVVLVYDPATRTVVTAMADCVYSAAAPGEEPALGARLRAALSAKTLAAAFMAALLCAAPARAQAPLDGPFRRVEAIDGDTVVLRVSAGLIREITIRLKDIDAPETHRPGCDEERRKGEEAASRLAVLTGRGVRIVSYVEIDSRGRLLARLYDRQNRDVGAVMIAEGHARPLKDGEARRPWCPPGAAP